MNANKSPLDTILAGVLAVALAVACALTLGAPATPTTAPTPAPVAPVAPVPTPAPDPVKPRPCPPNRPCPREQDASSASTEAAPGKPVVGGKVAPDGVTEITADLPASEKKKNTGGMGPRGPGSGAGLCVFTSIEYAARWQNERRLFDLQEKMTHEPGGGYPEKVDKMLAKYAPGVQYGQHTGGDPAVLEAVLASGRMCGVTYNGHDPHYSGGVAHMVDLVYFDKDWACITDNNYPGDNEFVWMSRAEFLQRWKTNNGGWAFFLLNSPPPPCPKNWSPPQ